MMEEFGIDSRVSATQAGWQNALIERHGKIFAETWDKLVYQFGVKGRKACRRLAAIVFQAKNSVLTRAGVTPEQAVFGRPLRWTESANRDDEETMWGLSPRSTQKKSRTVDACDLPDAIVPPNLDGRSGPRKGLCPGHRSTWYTA